MGMKSDCNKFRGRRSPRTYYNNSSSSCGERLENFSVFSQERVISFFLSFFFVTFVLDKNILLIRKEEIFIL